MVIGPFGFDAAAVTDVVAVIRDLCDRVGAPHRILHKLNYVIDREDRMALTEGDQASRSPANQENSAQALLSDYPFLTQTHREQKAGNSALTWRQFVKLATRRDLFCDVLATAEQYQNNNLLEEIGNLERKFRANFAQVRNTIDISPCQNESGAQTLKDCASTYLRSLKQEDQDQYIPIHRSVNGSSRPVPIWGPAPKFPHLFHHPHGKKRLEVLLHVAKSLEIAHGCRWYHGRLAPSMIQRLKSRPSNGMPSRHLPPIVVLNFYNKKNGCRSCERCHPIPLETPKAFTFRHNYTSSVKPSQDDALIFGNVICWIYTSELYDFTESTDSDSNREILQHVPWPLHFLIADGLRLPMSTIRLWLSHLYEKDLQPHSFDQPLIPLNLSFSRTTSSSFATDVPSEATALHASALRAVLHACSEGESEAIVHLGNYWEERARAGIDLPSENGVNPHNCAMTKAYNCYQAATKLGNEEGLLCVARLQTAVLFRNLTLRCVNPRPTSSCILSIILDAALRGNQRAFYYLSRISEKGLQSILRDDNSSLTSDRCSLRREPVDEQELMQVVWRIGCLFRTGDLDLDIPRCEFTAVGWLGVAEMRGFPPAIFDVGMHLVQSASNSHDAMQGFERLKKLCNSVPHESALQACFRVGRWLYHGLPHEFANKEQTNAEESTNIQDPARSISYIRKAAEGGISDAKVLYAVILRKGVAEVLDPDISASEKLLSQVKRSPSAKYAEALQLITMARKAYDKQSRQQSFALSAGESIGSVSNGRTSSHKTNSSEEKLPGRSHQGRILSVLGGRRRRQENPCDGRSIQRNEDVSSSKLNTNGRMNPAVHEDEEVFKQDVKQGFLDPNGDLTRKGIARCFEVCEDILTKGPPNFEKWPGERFNPYPYYTAGRLMMKYSAVWAECASSGNFAEEERALLDRARRHLNVATSVVKERGADGQKMWEKLRIDWRQEDLRVIRQARSGLEQLVLMGF